jgi:succinate dehydrogenase / fumarate reductase cytochrome b subunit
MRRVTGLYQTSIGKKISMACTGLILFGFVFVHMVGNLKIYFGQEKFDAYAKFLREFGYPALGHEQFLWIARTVLLGAVLLHILAATQLTLMSWSARPTKNKKRNDISFSYASRTMRYGGVIVGLFVVYHILHLTVGAAHPDFVVHSAYHNVVAGFQIWWVSAIYIATMVFLGLHLYHGLWSMTQTFGFENPRILKWRRPVAAALAAIVALGNISIPLAVLAGVVR